MSELFRGIEIERKYIIAMPEVDELRCIPGYKSSDIEQTYLESVDGVTHRVRKRTTDGVSRYYETVKTRIDQMSVIEDEGEIGREEYEALLSRIAVGTETIIKTRHSFPYCGRVIEIDVYPEWEHTAIMETELDSRDREVEFPAFLKIIRDVTGEKSYSNAAMSHKFPKEETL